MRAGDEVVVFHDQIADGRGRHVQPQRLPVVAVIERHVDFPLRAGEEQPLALRIFADDIDRRAIGNAVRDGRPRPAAVVRAVDVRPQVVEPQRVDRRVCRLRVEVPRVHDGHLHPRLQVGRGDVAPFRAPVHCHMHQSIVGADPEAVHVERRRCDGVDHASPCRPRRLRGAVFSNRRRRIPCLSRQVGADLLPAPAAGRRFPERVRREVHDVRIDGGEDHRRGAQRPEIRGADRCRRDVLNLAGLAVVSRDLAAVDDVGVQRIGHGVAVFLDADRMPLAERNHPVAAAAGDAGRAALLLAAADAVRERVVGVDVVHLRRRLVVPGAPGLAAVDRDDRALIARHRDDVRIVRVDPRALIVVAAGRAAQRDPVLAAVLRAIADGARDDHRVGILRVDRRHRQVTAADASRRPRVDGNPRPVLACVVGPVDADRARVGHGGIDPIRIARSDRDVSLHDTVAFTPGQPLRQLSPRRAAVGRFEDAAARACPRAVFPGPLSLLP